MESLTDEYVETMKRLYKTHTGCKHATPEYASTFAKCFSLFGNPQSDLKVIKVAGTNGKGSVSLKVARVLEQAGFKIGLVNSPHISTFRERISINGKIIPMDIMLRMVNRIESMLI